MIGGKINIQCGGMWCSDLCLCNITSLIILNIVFYYFVISKIVIQISLCRFSDADTSEMDGAADTMPTVSESMPLLTMSANGSALLSPTLLTGNISLVTYS